MTALPTLSRVIAAAAAVAIPALLFAGAAANAQPRTAGAFYTAELSQPATASRIVAGGLAWNCAGTSCTAPRGASRPAIVCARLVREAGQIVRFSADNAAFDEATMARCNARG